MEITALYIALASTPLYVTEKGEGLEVRPSYVALSSVDVSSGEQNSCICSSVNQLTR